MTTDAKLSEIFSSIIADDKRFDSLHDIGVYDEAISKARSDLRGTREEELFGTPAAGIRGIAVKLRALWPELTNLMEDAYCKPRNSYAHAPDDDADQAVHRLWSLISEAEKLADEEERKHAKPSTTGLIDFYKEEVEKAGR